MRHGTDPSDQYRVDGRPVRENQVNVNLNDSEDDDSEHKMNDALGADRVIKREHTQYQEGNDQDNMEYNKPIKFKRVKNHGFTFPLHPQQIATWIITAVLVITFYLFFLLPGTYFIHVAWVTIIGIVYGILLS